ncbi:MAG TPA: ferritin-like domain-containing protein [Kiloniellaceae bacterium]|nr:ferritin-like domain-containing protein [Kiloniellaceae bacterium]
MSGGRTTGTAWRPDDLPWAHFDPSKLDGNLLKVVKAASLVEFNGADYAIYLCNVFNDDPEFQAAAKTWAAEEIQHGAVLARWAALADPTFDFEASFRRFTEGYAIPLDAEASVRGSRAGELVARCIVEVGTSSYYTALADASEEPLLTAICRRIAADELRHYKLFYDHLNRYLDRDGIGRWQRIRVALGRIGESEDDELAYAYFAANGEGAPYDRRRWSRAYLQRAYRFYRRRHLRRAVAMAFKAAGLNPQSPLTGLVSNLGYGALRLRLALGKAA